jgi:hypothetical protein
VAQQRESSIVTPPCIPVRTRWSSRALAVASRRRSRSRGRRVHGGLYKCARDDGTVMYQEDPCPAGRELRDFERDPPRCRSCPSACRRRSAAPTRGARQRGSREDSKSRKSSARQGALRGIGQGRRFGDQSRGAQVSHPGIGEGEVVARIGRPDMSTGAGRKTVRWTYLPAPEDPQTITTLTFELGRLIQVERKVVRTP